MNAQNLNVRLNADEAALLARLSSKAGLTKSEIVRRALHEMAAQLGTVSGAGLYELGRARFGRYGDASRQSADIKRLVRGRN